MNKKQLIGFMAACLIGSLAIVNLMSSNFSMEKGQLFKFVGKYVHIGSGGTVDFVNGDGDLYVEGDMENDGAAYLQSVYFGTYWGKFISTGLSIYDDIELVLGSDTDFSLGYSNSDDEARIVVGDNVTTDTAVAFAITVSTQVVTPQMGVGDTQGEAIGALGDKIGMLWADSNDDYTVKYSTGP